MTGFHPTRASRGTCAPLAARFTAWGPARGATLLATVVATLTACGDRVTVPRTYGPLDLGEADHCAIVNGRFDVQEPLVRWAVVERVLPFDSTRGPIEAFSLLGNADQSLRLLAWSDGRARDTVRLQRDRDYRCSERRVVLDLPTALPADVHDAPVLPGERQTRAYRLALALGAEGALTAELSHETFVGFPVWCGDGCRYLPVPFSRHTSHEWTRVYPLPEDGKPFPRRRVTAREQRQGDRLLEEERALEEGRPLPRGPASRLLQSRAEARERSVENGGPPR